MISGDDRVLVERSVRHATETSTGEALDAALDGLGWHDALAEDPRVAVSVLFELQGRAGATSSALDAVLATALGIDLGADRPSTVAVVLPPLGATAAPGAPAGDGLEVRGLATAAVHRAERVVVATPTALVVVATEALTSRPVTGLDPRLGLVEVTAGFSGAMVAELATRSPENPGWAGAVAAGQVAIAHELIGASRAMLQLARDHAVERIQFDQPIARFQAVRHRLADAYVAIEAADAAASAAWEDGSPLAAAAAKAVAGRGARLVGRHCQQVLAGIGFTTEHPFHRFLRRALVLDRLLGDARSLTRAMGEELLRSRQVPPMLPL